MVCYPEKVSGTGGSGQPAAAVTGRISALSALCVYPQVHRQQTIPPVLPDAPAGVTTRAGCAARCKDARQSEDRSARTVPGHQPLAIPPLSVRAVKSFVLSLCIVLALCSIRPLGAPAQNDADGRTGYGGAVYILRSLHTADFDSLPGIPQARERFTSGSGTSIGFGGIVRLPFMSRLALSLRAGFTGFRGEFSATQQEPGAPGGAPVILTIRHTVAASFGQMSLLPMLEFSPVNRLRLTAGPEAGFLLYNTVTQQEEIIDPPGATWVETGTPVQTLFDGTLDEAQGFQAAAVLGAGYTIPLSGTLSVTPELHVSFPLTRLYPAGGWQARTYRAGLSLLFTPPPPALPVLYDTVRTRDTVVRIVAGLDQEQILPDSSVSVTEGIQKQEALLMRTTIHETYVRQLPELKPLLSASIMASFVLDDGRETRAAKVTMEEFIVNKYIPLLPYLFFGEGSAVLPERYSRLSAADARQFDIKNRNKLSTLETYHHLLNIIGQRLRSTDASLHITGYTAGEKDGLALAGQRAETVAEYLSSVWNIPSSRLIVSARQLPDHPSSMASPEGTEENRRVELRSPDVSLFAPVILTDTVRTVDPPTVRFRRRLFSETGIRHWSILITQADHPLKEIRGDGPVPPLVDWQISMDDIRPAAAIPLEYRLTVTDSSGQSFLTPPNSILFEQLTISKKKLERRADKVIDRFSLLLFDYDASALSARHETTLGFIRRRLQPQSTIRITGTTDRLGEEEYNRLLSQRRARETADALGAASALVTGAGEDTVTYSNDVPEGRFYSRTVRIIIETPVAGQARPNE